MNVAVVSLSSLAKPGGSERFTLDTLQSIRANGDRAEAFAVHDEEHGGFAGLRRDDRRFLHTFDAHGERDLLFHDVLALLTSFDVVWVHQYLASDLVFDILAAVHSSPVLLTGLGNRAIERTFAERYRPARNHHFVAPNRVLAHNSGTPASREVVVPAGIWSDSFGFAGQTGQNPLQLCTMGGVLPSSALETAILALPERCSLVVAGTPGRDVNYLRYIGGLTQGRQVSFTGNVAEARRRTILATSRVLLAPDAPQTLDGTSAPGDCFSGTSLLLEALDCDTLPLVSDTSLHVEIMCQLGLGQYVFPARNHVALQELIERVLVAPSEAIAAQMAEARREIHRSFLWDDYWDRVRRELKLERPRAIQGPLDRLRLRASHASATTGSATGHKLDWKALQY